MMKFDIKALILKYKIIPLSLFAFTLIISILSILGLPTSTVFHVLLNGYIKGSIYLLPAIGMSLLVGIFGFPDVVIGKVWFIAPITIAVFMGGGIPFPIAIVAGLGVPAALAIAVEMGVFKHIRGISSTRKIVCSLGMFYLVEWIFSEVYGKTMKGIPIQIHRISISGFHECLSILMIMILVPVILVGLSLLFKYTKFGKAIRATSEDLGTARLLGVDVDNLERNLFIFAYIIAAVSGIFLGIIQSVSIGMGLNLIILVFAIVMVAGAGNLIGVVVVGLMAGIIETALLQYLSSTIALACLYIILTAILAVRPRGLFR